MLRVLEEEGGNVKKLFVTAQLVCLSYRVQLKLGVPLGLFILAVAWRNMTTVTFKDVSAFLAHILITNPHRLVYLGAKLFAVNVFGHT